VFIPFDEVDTFHGRAATAGEDKWSVDPSRKNGKGDNVNDNVHHRSALYVTDPENAPLFAKERRRQEVNGLMHRAVQKEVARGDPNDFRDVVHERAMSRWSSYTAVNGAKRLPPERYGGDSKEWTDTELYRATDIRRNNLSDEEKTRLRELAEAEVSAETIEVIAQDADAVIMDEFANLAALSKEEGLECAVAIKKLLPRVSEALPLKFREDEAMSEPIADVQKLHRERYKSDGYNARITGAEAKAIALKHGVDELAVL